MSQGRYQSFLDRLDSNAAVRDLEHKTEGYREEIRFVIDANQLHDGKAELQQVDWNQVPGPYNCWPLSKDELQVVVIP